jgi:dihydrofolate reductase
MKCSVFIGTSVDGFIARHDGRFDFLPAGGGEPHGYDEFIASVDTIVIGRNTFEVVRKFSDWPYEDKRVVVLSNRALDLSGIRGKVEHMAGDPVHIVARLEASAARHAYIDGGITVQRFLRSGLIQRLIITRVPVLIGQGIPLFASLGQDIELKHVATQHYKSGMVKTEYEVIGPATRRT